MAIDATDRDVQEAKERLLEEYHYCFFNRPAAELIKMTQHIFWLAGWERRIKHPKHPLLSDFLDAVDNIDCVLRISGPKGEEVIFDDHEALMDFVKANKDIEDLTWSGLGDLTGTSTLKGTGNYFNSPSLSTFLKFTLVFDWESSIHRKPTD